MSEFGFACANAPKIDSLRPSMAAAGSPASASFPNSRRLYGMGCSSAPPDLKVRPTKRFAGASAPGSWLLVQRERVQRVVHGDEHVLLPGVHVGLQRVGRRADARVPQRIAVGRVERDEAAAAVAGEEHLPRRRENAAA